MRLITRSGSIPQVPPFSAFPIFGGTLNVTAGRGLTISPGDASWSSTAVRDAFPAAGILQLTTILSLMNPEPGTARPGNGPGPFAFADPDRVRRILEPAGFADVGFEKLDEALSIAGNGGVDLAAEFLVQMGPTGRLLREANDAALIARVTDTVREALRPYATAGGVRMPSAAWVVTAVNR